MQINNRNNNRNIKFSAIYRLPHTNSKVIKDFKDSVLPVHSLLKQEPGYCFIGHNPYEAAFVETLGEGAKMESCSYEWLLLNAKNHGIKLPDLRDTDGWIFTGMEDLNSLKKFMFSKKLDLMVKFKQIFNRESIANRPLPPHLNTYKRLIHMNEINSEKFQTVIKDKQITTVQDISELLQKMVEEIF